MRPPGVIGLELWDLELDTGIVWDAMRGAGLTDALADAATRLLDGRARTRSRTPIPAEARDFEAVWLAGGASDRVDRERLSETLGRPVWQSPDPQAVSARGAAGLVADVRHLAVVDLGQSHLKLFAGEYRVVVPRPWDRLPMREDCTDPVAVARRSLREWVAGALASVPIEPNVVVVALPCEFGDAPIPGGCSYAGLGGDERFVPDVVAAAGWSPDTLWVLNDAELAAAAARLDPRTRHTSTLVLTLGFGIGAALLQP